jgi:hypothetical protein
MKTFFTESLAILGLSLALVIGGATLMFAPIPTVPEMEVALSDDEPPEPAPPQTLPPVIVLAVETIEPTALPEAEPIETVPPDEIEAIALTLAGECWEDKPHDKRLVCEVILNRVSSARWSDTVIGVLTQRGQFAGYWEQSRPVSDNDIEIATQALSDWYEGDCEPLSEYLFFESGRNRENVFRAKY